MSEATFSTLGGRLVRLQLRGGLKPWGVEQIEVCNFEPHVVARRIVGDMAFVTIEGTQRSARSVRTWQQEVPEQLLSNPRILYRALCGPMGASATLWVGQQHNFARFLLSELEELAAST
jgi:hypothetical protein